MAFNRVVFLSVALFAVLEVSSALTVQEWGVSSYQNVKVSDNIEYWSPKQNGIREGTLNYPATVSSIASILWGDCGK